MGKVQVASQASPQDEPWLYVLPLPSTESCARACSLSLSLSRPQLLPNMKFEKPDILARWYPSEVSLEGEELLSGAQKPQKRRPISNAYWVFAWVLSISASCSLSWSLARNSCHLSSFDDTSVADQVASLNWYCEFNTSNIFPRAHGLTSYLL